MLTKDDKRERKHTNWRPSLTVGLEGLDNIDGGASVVDLAWVVVTTGLDHSVKLGGGLGDGCVKKEGRRGERGKLMNYKV